MKASFTTHIDKLLDDIDKHARDVLDKAYESHGGYFTVAVSTPRQPGSDKQNRAWHSLIGEYWKSGCSSYDCYEDMRDALKLRICGAKEYIWLDDVGHQHTAKIIDEIPRGAYYVAVPKSWTDFSKGERAEMIDSTIQEMVEAGVNSRKFDEILQGLEGLI